VSWPDPAMHPLSADGGIDSAPTVTRDPFEALDDLMQVVEALCPIWPERPLFSDSAGFRL
jgi:hypothetical protein